MELGKLKCNRPPEILELLPKDELRSPKTRMSDNCQSDNRFKGVHPPGKKISTKNDAGTIKKNPDLLWPQMCWLVEYIDRKKNPEKYKE